MAGFFKNLLKKKFISFEFFPPKTDPDNFFLLVDKLQLFNPAFMSVTCGAGGGNNSKTDEIVAYINKIGGSGVAHFTAVGKSVEEIDVKITELTANGIDKILALRGDAPKDREIKKGDFDSAADLLKLLKTHAELSLATAGYPEPHRDSLGAEKDLEYLKSKVDSGAEIIITQLFFNNEHYYRFVDSVVSAGIDVPILPGILPIGNYNQLMHVIKMCGALVPEKLGSDLAAIQDNNDEVLKYGLEFAHLQCEDLLKNNAPGIHLFTLNKSSPVEQLAEMLKGAWSP